MKKIGLSKIISVIIIFTLLAYSLLAFFNNETYAVSQSISSDINGINESLYPGFKEKIKTLQSQYPNWEFKVLYTDLEWSEVISNEYTGHNSGPRNMIQATSNYQGQWICPICSYSNGSWKCASQSAIEYMMDPRNSLNSSDIFQFEQLTINGCDINAINSMINGTFLQGHANEIANSANSTGINPYYIVARLIQEQGRNGSATSSGSSGYYNPFNIGATGNSDSEVIENAINYARNKGWNTLEKGITGGINFIANSYIKQGQNTLYLQKFDVENAYNGLYWHQYMQNLMAAQSEGTTLRNTYSSTNSISSSHTFIIPLYKNMPSVACSRPNGNSSATVSGDIVKVNSTTGLNLRNAPAGSIVGAVSSGEIVTRIEKATSKVSGTYWDKIRRSNGEEGYVARETYDYESQYKLYLLPLGDDSSSDSNNNSSNTGNNTDNTGNTGDTGNGGNQGNNNQTGNSNTGTSDNGNTGNTSNVTKGDVNKDVKISASDYVLIKNCIMGTISLDDTAKKAADVNGDGKISASDYVLVKNYIMGIITSF